MTGGLIWIVAATLLQVFGSRVATRWSGVVVVLAAAVTGAVTSQPLAAGFSALAGAIVLAAIGTGHPAENRGLSAYCVVTGLALLAVSTEQLVFSSLALFAICALLSLRWMSVAPGRQTVSGVRALCVGAATLAAIVPLLPVPSLETGPLPAVVIAMVLVGYVPLLGLFPMNGWAVSAGRSLNSLDSAPWFFVVVPVAITVVFRILATLPALFEVNAAHLITFVGLLSGLWAVGRAFAYSGRERYFRIFFADIGLAAAALSSGSWQAITAAEILFAGHLVVYFFLSAPHAARGWWWVISGIPPSPGFWARLLVAQACAVTNVTATIVAVSISGLITVQSIQEICRAPGDKPAQRTTVGQRISAVIAGVVAFLIALVPQSLVHLTFGLR